MYAGVLGTIIRYNDNLEKWEVASEASAIRAEISASFDSYNLGIHDWKISGDAKCNKSLEALYKTKEGFHKKNIFYLSSNIDFVGMYIYTFNVN